MRNQYISIIVPVYNSEKYLCDCVNSLIHQTYKQLEIILVNDGSQDSSPQICDRFASIDSRVQVIHKDNGGVSSARNAGLEASSGEFVLFLDSDDLLPTNACEKLISKMGNNDCVIMGLSMFSDQRIVRQMTNAIQSSDPFEYLLVVNERDWHISCCRLMYRKKTILNECLRFSIDHRTGEDQEFAFKYLLCSERLTFAEDVFLMYRVSNSNSIMHKRSYAFFDAIEAMDSVLSFAETKLSHAKLQQFAQLINCNKKPYFLFFAITSLISAGERINNLLSFVNSSGYEKYLSKANSNKGHVFYRFVKMWKFSPYLCLLFVSFRKKFGRLFRCMFRFI